MQVLVLLVPYERGESEYLYVLHRGRLTHILEPEVRDLDENAVFALYQTASGDEKQRLQTELDRLLRKHAFAVCWLTLEEHRPDIVNDVVWKAFQHSDSFRGEAKFSTWFHYIVLNACRSDLRKRQTRKEQSLEELTSEPAGSGANSVEAKLDLERVAALLEEEDQEFMRWKLAGESETEISRKTGLTNEGVRSRWFLIKRKILKRLQT
jgi:RNA polymerase sigma factor (sigma-70 family)